MKRSTALSFACLVSVLALAPACALVDESSQTEESNLVDRACAPAKTDVKTQADDVQNAVAREQAEENALGDTSGGAAAQAPAVNTASGSVHALDGDAKHAVMLSLPGTRCGATLNDAERGITLFANGESAYSAAVAADKGGAFRALVRIDSAAAPNEYVFKLDLPAGGQLVELEDGGVAVSNADGELLATFTPPWAKDANGTAVPTRYEVRGNTLVQHVDHSSSAVAYPVVADPFWIPALFVMGHIGRHALIQMGRRGISEALVKQVVQNGARSRGRQAGTSVFTQGRGGNRIRVVVNNSSGKVITVTKG